ncbi:MAG: zinc finger domain-containing protein [Desulfurococcaceae archaeon]|nr:zinc finger domain-containing protein [Desulfurococcaceae archaeon]
MHEAANIRICSSCKRPIVPDEKAVSFKCPNCGAITIWRCHKCRTMGTPYKCPNCGFEGP